MRRLNNTGIIIIVVGGIVALIIIKLPKITKEVSEVANESKKERLELNKKEKEEELKQKRIDDSIKQAELKKLADQKLKNKEAIETIYNNYYSFINDALKLNGNIETTNFLVLRRFDFTDSSNIYIIYRKVDIKDNTELRQVNSNPYVYLEDFYKQSDWFNNNKYIIPNQADKFGNFNENKYQDLDFIMDLMKNFKAECLIEKN